MTTTAMEWLAVSSVSRTLCLASLCLIAMFLWSRRRFYRLSYQLPGPKWVPIFGDAFVLGVFGDHRSYLEYIIDCQNKYGGFFRLWLGPELCLVTAEAPDIEEILLCKQAANKGQRYSIFAKSIGNGILVSSGHQWKKSRHILNPAFNAISIKSYQAVIEKHSKFLCQGLLKECNKGYVDVTIHCTRWTADVLMEALFGCDCRFHECDKDNIVTLTQRGSKIIHERLSKFWCDIDFIFNNTGKGKLLKKIFANYDNYYHKILSDKIDEALIAMKINEGELSEEDDEKKSKLVSTPFTTMVNAIRQNKFTKREFLSEFNSIYNAGADTCYTHLSFFILMMGMHKRCQDLVWKEIQEVFGDDIDRPVTVDDLPKMKYLEMCFKEVARLFPTGPTQMRRTDEDFYLKNKNLVIPAETTIFLSIFVLHRNPKYWDSPNLYVPERFLPENSKNRPHFAFVPFSGGLRDCIGRIFGYNKLKTAAIHLIRAMEFHSDLRMEDFKVVADISTRSAKGYNAVITKRDRSSNKL